EGVWAWAGAALARRRADRDQRNELGPPAAHGIDPNAHGLAVEEARAPGLVHLSGGARAIERGGGADTHREGACVAVLVDRLMRLRQLLPRVNDRRVDRQRAVVDQARPLVGR